MIPQLIVTGMHRSGTSLVASVLEQAGLHIGADAEREVKPLIGQPRGHFEDHDFFELHEAILAALERSCFSAGEAALGRLEAPGALAALDPSFEARARALVAARSGLPFWGWKDPRTALFLGLWDRLLPDARYLFLYRHPVDVALSLWRRNLDLEVKQDPWLAFRAWETYNRRLLAFRDRHPERCFLAHAPALAADFPSFFRRLGERFALPLAPGDAGALYEPRELAPSCRAPRPDWEELIPQALALYREIEEKADLDSSGESAAPPETPEIRRQRSILQGSEILLHSLLHATRGSGWSPDLAARREFVRLRVQEEARLRGEAQVRREAAMREVPLPEIAPNAEAKILQSLDRSRAFRLLNAWWRLRRRLAGAGKAGGGAASS